MLTDPLSQARVRPDYSAELTAWRVQLRPFLYPGGNLAEQRELESMSPDVQMCQSAVHLTEEGVRRRREFTGVFNRGRGAANRASCPPHFLTAAEKAHFEADSRRTIASLRQEFVTLLGQLPDQVASDDLCASFEAASHKDSVLECVMAMRQLVTAAVSTDVQEG